MTRSNRMKVVHNYAQTKETEAATMASSSRNAFEQQKDRLSQLHDYRQEYWTKLSNTKSSHFNAASLQDYRIFISRIDQAIEQQQQVVNSAEQDHKIKQQDWMHKRTKAKAIETVVTNLEEKERKHAQKVEQKDMDEQGQKVKIRFYETEE
ncbi:MAG: flagellar export protein FliJ [Gammaproteobacteria bacterium]|nr:MAG: flagellar export protein FliJ [Gammaproteobacteria bacterium]